MSIPSRYCISCGNRFRPVTVRHKHCLRCLKDVGPDLIIDQGSYHAEIISELMPEYKLNKLLDNLKNNQEVKVK